MKQINLKGEINMPSHYGKSKMKSKNKGLKGGQKRLPAALKSKLMKSNKRKY